MANFSQTLDRVALDPVLPEGNSSYSYANRKSDKTHTGTRVRVLTLIL